MKRNLLYAIILAGACILTFAGTLNYPFLLCMDDWAYVTHNPNLVLDWQHFWGMVTTPVIGLATPLPQGSFFLDYALGGFQPWIYRLFNLLWHIGTVWLVCRFFRELGIGRKTAFFLAVVFAVHPQRVESVVWISERKDVMCTFFFTLSCVLQQKALRHRKPFSPGSAAAMAAACLCKPSAVFLPLVLMALDFHRTHRVRLRPVLVHMAVAVLYFFVFRLQGAGNNISGSGLNILLAVRNYCMYFFKTLYPANLCPLYPYVTITGMDYLLIGGCIAALFIIGCRQPAKLRFDVLPLLFSAGLVLGPVSGIMVFSNADFADRYSYIPSVFFLSAVAMILPPIPEKFRRWCWLYPAVLFAGSHLYAPVWNGDEALLQAATSQPNCNFRAALNSAGSLASAGRLDQVLIPLEKYDHNHQRTIKNRELIDCFEKGMHLLYRSRNGADPALLPEFTALLNTKRNRKAIQRLDYAVLIPLMTAFADCALAAGRPAMASRIYDGLADDYSEETFYGLFYHGVAAMLRRDPAAAVPYFEQAHRIHPDDETTLRNLEAARRKTMENMPSALK